MTSKDLLNYALGILFVAVAAGYLAAALAEIALPGAALTQAVVQAYGWLLWLAGGALALIIVLLAAWGIRQGLAEGTLFYVDRTRAPITRRAGAEADDYLLLDLHPGGIPEPRRSHLNWLQMEITQALTEGDAHADPD